jgi:hypothetical protein
MKTMGGSYHNLAALATADFSDARQAQATRFGQSQQNASTLSLDSASGKSRCVLLYMIVLGQFSRFQISSSTRCVSSSRQHSEQLRKHLCQDSAAATHFEPIRNI